MRYLLTVVLLGLATFAGAKEPPEIDTTPDPVTPTPAADGASATDAAEPAADGQADASSTAAADAGDSTDADAADPSAEDADEAPGNDVEEDAAADEDAELAANDRAQFFKMFDEITSTGAIGYLRAGGLFMWPILLMAVVAVGVMIERYRSLKLLGTDTSWLRSQVARLLENDRIEEALELCENEKGPVPAVLGAGVRKYLVLRRLDYDPGRIEEQVVGAMEDYAVHVIAALERHLPVLATVSSVAPMLGFLGTVAGMITSFNDIVAQSGESNIVEAAAAGISVALLTTAFGLIVGIPAFMAYNYFTSVINRSVLEMEESSTDLIESVTLQLSLRGGQSNTNPQPVEKEKVS